MKDYLHLILTMMINMTTILDLLKKVDFKDVERDIKHMYPETPDKALKLYKKVFNVLLKKKKTKVKDNEDKLQIGTYSFIEEGKIIYYYDIYSSKYSLSFRKWGELVNLPINEDMLRYLFPSNIITLFLWEITFYGFEEEEISKIGKGLLKARKEIIKNEEKKERKN